MKKFFTSILPVFIVCVYCVTVVGQNPAPEETIIPQGKAGLGKELFVQKGCYKCHSVKDTELPKVEVDPRYAIPLGGPDHAEWTRDQFGAAIMNPNHTVAEEYRIAMMTIGDHVKAENSPMPTFNDFLTVSDLIHLATFLGELP